MSCSPAPAPSKEGLFTRAGDFHVELRPYQDQWEFQFVSLKEHKVLREGLTLQFDDCRREAISAAELLSPSLDWDAVQWLPLHAGR